MFNIEKLIQTCNYLLQKSNGSLNYTKMIKLIYLADRISLNEVGDTITGDTYVSMDNGPVLSNLYNLVMNKYEDREQQILWNSRFTKDGYNLIVLSDRIPQGELSRFEMSLLDTIFSDFRDYSYGKMIDFIHENCPEWQDPKGSSIPIKLGDILKSFGRTPEEIEWMIEEIDTFDREEKIFQSAGLL